LGRMRYSGKIKIPENRYFFIKTIDNDASILYNIIKYIIIIWEVVNMKKIINGKRYDTDTATLIGSAGYSYSGDLEYWTEELYRKKTGEFFLYCKGGALSRYGRQTGQNEWSGGEKIRPLSLKEAQEWAEEHLNADEYEQVFGKIEEGKTQIATWIADSVKADADQLREKGYTLADIFEAGVKYLTSGL